MIRNKRAIFLSIFGIGSKIEMSMSLPHTSGIDKLKVINYFSIIKK